MGGASDDATAARAAGTQARYIGAPGGRHLRGRERTMANAAETAETQELSAKVDALKRDIAEVASMAKSKVVNNTTQWAREHPAAAIGVVAGLAGAVGFALGLLVGRGRG